MLVVETMGFRDDGWLDTIGSPLTDEGKIIERFHRPWYGRMEIGDHDRRPEGVPQAIHRRRDAVSDVEPATDRVRMPREQPFPATVSGGWWRRSVTRFRAVTGLNPSYPLAGSGRLCAGRSVCCRFHSATRPIAPSTASRAIGRSLPK